MFSHIRDPDARARAVCEYGCNLQVDHAIPVKRFFRSGKEMIRMANVYLEEGEYESSFILYSKFITLFVEKLPKHPEYRTANPQDVTLNKKKLKEVFPMAELIKQKLKKKYAEQEAIRQKEDERLRKEEEVRLQKEREEAEAEEQRRSIEEAKREAEKEERRKLEQEQQLRALKEEERQRLERLQAEQDARDAAEALAVVLAAEAAEEALKRVTVGGGGVGPPPPAYGAADFSAVPPPAYTPTPHVPDRGLKPSAPSAPPASNASLPTIDRGSKPDHFTSVGAASNNPYGLKTVVVPAELMLKFLNLAKSNTDRKVETFGALCGKLVPSRNAFVLTHLVIPKQKGTPDSCEPHNEEEIFDVQDQHGLNFIGWIHTHPTQTAFLSSVDCHTQCNYQLLLPEMIAIVCSPKYQETGYFHLSPEHGLKVVSNCTQQGFHKHPDNPPLFQPCGHVQLDSSASVSVIDLRTS